MFRAALPALLVLLAAGCTPPPPSSASRASAGAVASCRASTNQSFDRQNRYLLSERSQTDTPFSTSFNSGDTTRGLTQRYDYDNQMASCLAASNAPQNANTAATVSGSAPAVK
jgi:hypothetical protein